MSITTAQLSDYENLSKQIKAYRHILDTIYYGMPFPTEQKHTDIIERAICTVLEDLESQANQIVTPNDPSDEGKV